VWYFVGLMQDLLAKEDMAEAVVIVQEKQPIA